MKPINRFISLILIVISIFMSMLLCVSCNAKEEESDGTRDFYIVDTSFYEDEGYMLVTIGLSGLENRKLNLDEKPTFLSTQDKDTVFFTKTTSCLSFKPESIFCAVNNLLTQDEKFYNGMLYSTLKVELQYATIYKSINSEGKITKEGNLYVHRFDVEDDKEEQDVILTMRQQNSAAWYGILIPCSVGLLLILLGISLIWRNKHGKERSPKIDEDTTLQ